MQTVVAVALSVALGLLIGVCLWRESQGLLAPSPPEDVPTLTPASTTQQDGDKGSARLLYVILILVGLGVLAWAGWAFWGNQPTSSHPSDRWLDVMTGIGATVAAAGVLVGGVFAWLYGRRASVSVTAKVHPIPGGNYVLSVRPQVKAVGIFRVKFRGAKGAIVTVGEVHLDSSRADGMRVGNQWVQEAAFGHQHVDGGEELFATAMFRLATPPYTVVGWLVGLGVVATRRRAPGASEAWSDRVFVPRPDSDAGSLSID